MLSKKIVFYTQVYFLDAAVEYISLLTSKGYFVHVLIELSPNQLNANILNIDTDLRNWPPLTSFALVEEEWNLQYLSPYFKECSSVNFCVHSTKNLRHTWSVSKKVELFIRNLNPDFIHLDDFSQRSLFHILFFWKQRNIIRVNIHDPKAHSGEFQWQRALYRKLWFNMLPHFVVFSEFSRGLLKQQLPKSKKITVLSLMPYTVYRSFVTLENKKVAKRQISFVGRISPYKGVDLFIEAMQKVRKSYPEQEFYIGGKVVNGYNPDFLQITHKNLTIDNKFLTNEEIVSVIKNSSILVCPYKDATQSGVIMTSYALGCPVMVSNTGGLPEYVAHDVTGSIVQTNKPTDIAEALSQFLKNNSDKQFKKNLEDQEYLDKFKEYNRDKMPELYA